MKFLINAAVFASVVATGCTASQGEESYQMQASPFPTVKVEKANLIKYDRYPASVEGESNIEIRAKVSGYISKVYVDEGQEVKKGQLLFRLETETLSQNARAAKAAVAQAGVEVARLEPLVKQNIVSPVTLRTARAALDRAKGDYAGILADIGYTAIKSPVNGVVSDIRFREGTLVGPSSQKALTSVSSIDQVYVYFSMNEKRFLEFTKNIEGNTFSEKIAKMPAVKLQLADGSEYGTEGTIQTVTGEIDKRTGSVQFRAVFPNPAGTLRNGSSGQVMIPTRFDGALTVPAMATAELQEQSYVYAVQQGDSVSMAFVKLGGIIDNRAIVLEGLKEGQTIVGQGMNRIRPGMTIQPVPTSTDQLINSIKTVF
ncbi:efflux RND transporter periplasmic adaptor subunit [Fulvitalea axinellae]